MQYEYLQRHSHVPLRPPLEPPVDSRALGAVVEGYAHRFGHAVGDFFGADVRLHAVRVQERLAKNVREAVARLRVRAPVFVLARIAGEHDGLQTRRAREILYVRRNFDQTRTFVVTDFEDDAIVEGPNGFRDRDDEVFSARHGESIHGKKERERD